MKHVRLLLAIALGLSLGACKDKAAAPPAPMATPVQAPADAAIAADALVPAPDRGVLADAAAAVAPPAAAATPPARADARPRAPAQPRRLACGTTSCARGEYCITTVITGGARRVAEEGRAPSYRCEAHVPQKRPGVECGAPRGRQVACILHAK